MQEWIRQIIIYVLIVTVLRSLIMKPQYEQYFRFFSGLVLILLVISPVLHVLHQDASWYDSVERYLERYQGAARRYRRQETGGHYAAIHRTDQKADS